MSQNKKLIGASLATTAALIFSSAAMTSALAATTTTTTNTTPAAPVPANAPAETPAAASPAPAPTSTPAAASPPVTVQAAPEASTHPAAPVPTVRTIIKAIINRHDSLMQLNKPGNVRCFGLNGCRGLGSCRTITHACKGQNDCSGKGFIIVSAKDCKNAAGTTEEPREEKISLVNKPVQ